MRRALLAVAALLALTSPVSARDIIKADQDYQGFHAYHLADPTTAFDPGTAPARLTDLNPSGSPCLLASPGSLGVPTCGSPTTLFTPDAPLVFGGVGGTHLQLTYDARFGLSGSTLQRSALVFSGAITGTMGAGSNSLTTAFGPQGPLSLFGVAGSSTAVPASIGPGTALQVPQVNSAGTAIGWATLSASGNGIGPTALGTPGTAATFARTDQT